MPMRIADRQIGRRWPCFIIAELSANHAGDYERARELVRLAAECNADAVKLQTFTPEAMAPAGVTLTDGAWAGRELVDLYREAETPRAWHAALLQYARDLGMLAFSTAATPADADFLAALGVPCFKVASFELTDTVLLKHLSTLGKPVLLSTGMATQPEIRAALDALYPVPVCLLHCVSAYPTPLDYANLHRIDDLRENFGRDVGLSWHNVSAAGPAVAVSRGCAVLEVHIRDDGPETLDADFSMRPPQFAAMVALIRDIEALGARDVREIDGPQRALRRPPGGKRGALCPT